MKSKTGWENNGNGSDSFGFGALPGGYYIFYYGEEIFTTLGTDGYWWTSSGPETTESWYRSIFYYSQFIYRQRCNKQMGYNVRCVKDE